MSNTPETTVLKPTADTGKSQGVEYIKDKADEMEWCYTILTKIFILSLGPNPHFSNAMYNGNYSLTLEQAQEAKCKWVAEKIGLGPGKRVIDLGCGWGGWLKYVKNHTGAHGVGVTLSVGQADHGKETGLDVHCMDMRDVKPETFGMFDAATAFGSFDHVLSYEEFLEGKEHEVYNRYFYNVAQLIPVGNYFYMQTMTFGRKIIPRETWDINAHTDSDEFTMALMVKQFPKSWLPYMEKSTIEAAKPYFEIQECWSGREDYVVTNREWTRRYKKFGIRKYWNFLKLLPRFISDKEFRYQKQILKYAPNRRCFERELFDHFRFLFKRVQ